jgi:tousled-like kinase
LGDAWKARAMESLRSHLKENELLKRREAKEAVQRDMAEIGSIGHERHGMDMVEVWIDGEKLKAIKLKQMEVQQQMDDIEALKKTAAKKKTATDSIDENAFMIQQEIFRSKKEGLKKQLDELAQEKEGLLVRRSLHIKEMKRIQDEEHSPFNSFPLLQNRYLMLQLLGKGGFSEVYKVCRHSLLQ